MSGGSKGGDDRLISGADAEDHMWGDFRTSDGTVRGGNDTFVFGPSNGTDHIHDFQQGRDTIELREIDNVASFADLDIESVDADQDGSLDSIVRFDDSNSITVYNVAALTRCDFEILD
jgi:hypothetical protein